MLDVNLLLSLYELSLCKWTILDFISEFASYLENIVYANCRQNIVGNFDILVDGHEDNNVMILICSIQYDVLCVTYVSHDKGHTLDLIII